MKRVIVPGVISPQPIPKEGEWNFKNVTTYPKDPRMIYNIGIVPHRVLFAKILDKSWKT